MSNQNAKNALKHSENQLKFLTLVADLLELAPDHPFRGGTQKLPDVKEPVLPVLENTYDIGATDIVGTDCHNDNFYLEKAVYELFRKADYTHPDYDKTQNAKNTFIEQMGYADACNIRLRTQLYLPDSDPLWELESYVKFRDIMDRAKQYCYLLTDYAVSVLEDQGIQPRFTDGAVNGSTKSLKKGNSPIERTSYAGVSSHVEYMARHLGKLIDNQDDSRTEAFWSMYLSRAKVVDAPDEANFVPKNYKTDRDTFKGFTADLAIQCGIGDLLSESLRRNGYDIRILPEIHKDLARMGSINGLTSTFDMKGGSQNCFSELGKFLLPPLLYDVLIYSRNDRVAIDDQVFNLPIMATAGNGFCFPLETILFLSLQMGILSYNGIKPVVKKQKIRNRTVFTIRRTSYHKVCSTFGDDVIVPSYIAHDLIDTFKHIGIRLNLDKSFWSGDFRESCGGHYLNGRDINCFNAKTVPTMENTVEIQKFQNGIRAFGYDNNRNCWRHPRLRSLWSGILEHSSGLTINQGRNGDAGVLVPWTYSETRYVKPRYKYVFTTAMRERIMVSNPSFFKDVISTNRNKSLRFSRKTYVKGFPLVTQKFLQQVYTDKIRLPQHLKQNHIPKPLLLKIAGEGLLSGSGHTPNVCLLCTGKEKCKHCSKHGVVENYPKYFIRDRLKIGTRVQHSDPFAVQHESVDDLFSEIGHKFASTRINRIHRDLLYKRRYDVWEKKRPMYLSRLRNLLETRIDAGNREIRDLFG